MLAATKELPICLSTYKEHVREFRHQQWFHDLSSVTEAHVRQVEEMTLEQASCGAWFHHRAGRITSSMVHRVLHTNPEAPSSSPLQDLLKPRSQTSQLKHPYVLWGKGHEKDGINTYLCALGMSSAKPATSKDVIMEQVEGVSCWF